MVRIRVTIEAMNSPARSETIESLISLRSGSNDIEYGRSLMEKITNNIRLLTNDRKDTRPKS